MSLSDLELIDSFAGPINIFRDDELPRHVFARIVFRVLYTVQMTRGVTGSL